MKFTAAVLLLLLSTVLSQCPESVDLDPCICVETSTESRVTCQGPIGLPRLTHVLRKDLCGATIKKVELIESDIQYLPSNLFFKMIVNDIQVSSTNISHFTQAGRSAFFGLEKHLNSLSMRRCNLVDGLQWQMIGELRALSYLDLSYNDLTTVPRQWFERPPPNLRSLILKGNKISILEPGALFYMYKLVELDLSENYLSTLSRNIFPNPGNGLIFLRLSYNEFTAFPEDLFEEMMGLRRIYLDSNKLTALPENLWSPIWGDLEHLDLYGNELECDCDMLWVSQLRPPKRLYGKCEGSQASNRTGKELRNLEPIDFESCIS